VDEALVLETSFLVDLERERHRGEAGAHAFLEANAASRVFVTFTTVGELAAGPRLQEREAWQELLSPFHVLPWSFDVAWQYGRIYRHLADEGRLIGANDLWIAATAIVSGLPLVTADHDDYRRVPGLELRTYRALRAPPAR